MIWHHLKQTACLPDNCGCELIHLDAWIRQPVNFWSSIVYWLVGIYLFKFTKTFHEKLWASLCIVLGFASHMGHASFTQLFMALDFASIITLMLFPVVMHHGYLRAKWNSVIAIGLSYGVIILIMFFLGKIPKIALTLLIFSIVLFYHFKYLRSWLNSSYFKKSLGLLILGFFFFILDENKIFCSAESLFQFHSVWHLLTAFSLYFYGRWIFLAGRW